MARNEIELCGCNYGAENRLQLTRNILEQVKALGGTTRSRKRPITIRLTETGRKDELQGQPVQGNSDLSTEISVTILPEDTCNTIFLKILEALHCIRWRPSRNLFVPLLASIVSSELEDFYTKHVDGEIFHIDLVRQVAKAVALETATTHDHTKDAFYLLVTFGKFGGMGISESSEFESVYSEELDHHMSKEPHHPEYETLNGVECKDCDIEEMAIDRLARNLVSSKGLVDEGKMAFYTPKFELGDTRRKAELYQESVKKYAPIVIEKYHKLIAERDAQPETHLCAKRSSTAPEVPACKGSCAIGRIYSADDTELTINLHWR